MITFTKEKYASLCASYLEYIEKTHAEPVAFIASQIRRFHYLCPEDETYITLMLLDDEDRKVLGELLVRIHYATIGKNYLVESEKGLAGEDADAAARELINDIVARSARFAEAVHKEQKRTMKKVNKKVNGFLTRIAALKKENRILGHEVKQLLDQAAKNRTRIEKNEAEIQELTSSLENLRNLEAD